MLKSADLMRPAPASGRNTSPVYLQWKGPGGVDPRQWKYTQKLEGNLSALLPRWIRDGTEHGSGGNLGVRVGQGLS